MRHEFAADEWNQQERQAKNEYRAAKSRLRVIEAPIQAPGVSAADPFKRLVNDLVNAIFEPVGTEHGDQSQREKQGAEERDGHRIGHRVKQLSGRTAECIDWDITG